MVELRGAGIKVTHTLKYGTLKRQGLLRGRWGKAERLRLVCTEREGSMGRDRVKEIRWKTLPEK